MSPELGVVIMMNNYFHDVATALLLASGVALWAMEKHYRTQDGLETDRYFLRIYRSMTRFAHFSLGWIILGGIPRTYFYVDFEWANAVGKMQVPALIVKHVIAFAFVGTGGWLWWKLHKRVKVLRARVGEDGGGAAVPAPEGASSA